jgi:pimeloyl-ACP methyl ester carboxylesterase
MANAEIIAGRPNGKAGPSERKSPSRERVIRDSGVEIATEAFGDPANPRVLLIMGAMASMLWWPQEFCRRLAAQQRYVIRYDNRDTGLSTTYEPGQPPYTEDDMIADAIRLLDGYGTLSAHIVGMSAGGMIGQSFALEHPGRVTSLTAISTSPVVADTCHLPQNHRRLFGAFVGCRRSRLVGPGASYRVHGQGSTNARRHRPSARRGGCTQAYRPRL